MSLYLPLARGHIDHGLSLRESDDVAELWTLGADPRVRRVSAIAVSADGFICVEACLNAGVADADAGGSSAPLALKRIDVERAQRLAAAGVQSCFLGIQGDGEAVVAIALEAPDADLGDWVPLQHSGHMLSDEDSAIAVSGVALAAWHHHYQRCPACGTQMHSTMAGWARACGQCGREEFPRHDMAVIVAVFDAEDRLLLAHNAQWRRPMASLVAGFVEAGETPEAAVLREVREEVGLTVERLSYQGSQPWPFPRSLMMGYSAHVVPGGDAVPQPDGTEIEWARFFSRDDYVQALRSGHVLAPGPASIAAAMIGQWLGAPIHTLVGAGSNMPEMRGMINT